MALVRQIAARSGAGVARLESSGFDYIRLMDANVSALAAALAAAR